MPAQLNHTIIWCHDQARSARFLTDILGLPEARPLYGFLVVDMANTAGRLTGSCPASAPTDVGPARRRRRMARRVSFPSASRASWWADNDMW
jgi:catechol 2,3-dioxygenase-like lactoylglutathione lyase family enzyme